MHRKKDYEAAKAVSTRRRSLRLPIVVVLLSGAAASVLPGRAAGAQTALPSLAVNDVSLAEGDSGSKAATFTVTRSGDTTAASYVSWATAEGTARAPSDYAAQATAPLKFEAGETTKKVAVQVRGDTAVEADETFFVKLSAPSGATIADDSGTGTIRNDDTSLSVNNASVIEGSGSKTMTFTVTRKGVVSGNSSFTWSTDDGNAKAGSDYKAERDKPESFVAGQTKQTLTVEVYGDTVPEPNETFAVWLTAGSGGTIADGIGVGTIKDDDTAISVGPSVSVVEGNEGPKTVNLTLTRSGNTAGTSSVTWRTEDGSASALEDYVAQAPTTVTFNPGETSKPISVTVKGDVKPEGNEVFYVRLSSPVGGTLDTATASITIVTDDDEARLSMSDVSISEGDSGAKDAVFTVTRSGNTAGSSTVTWSTADGSATGTKDYAPSSGSVTFAAGETTRTVSVPVNGETLVEYNETFAVNLSSPTGATIVDGNGVGTIVNDDTVPDVTDRPLSMAGPILDAAGLPYTTTSRETCAYPNGYVLSQSPAGGTSVAPGTPVKLTISVLPPGGEVC